MATVERGTWVKALKQATSETPIVLSHEQSARFREILANPTKPSQAARQAMQRMRKMFGDQ